MADRQEMAEKLKRYILTELINNADVDIEEHTPLITSGIIDSFSLARIGVFVEEEFDVILPDDEMTVDNMDSISKMLDLIETFEAEE